MPRDLWIFGYGSLMWRPGFHHAETRRARLHGYHRTLCVYSTTYRGTPREPGLVLGLDRGGACTGVAFRVAPGDRDAVLAYLDERELDTNVYRRRTVKLVTGAGRVAAETYVVKRDHPDYAGRLGDRDMVPLILRGRGSSGHCVDYVASTVRHLTGMGIQDRGLIRILDAVLAAGGVPQRPPRS